MKIFISIFLLFSIYSNQVYAVKMNIWASPFMAISAITLPAANYLPFAYAGLDMQAKKDISITGAIDYMHANYGIVRLKYYNFCLGLNKKLDSQNIMKTDGWILKFCPGLMRFKVMDGMWFKGSESIPSESISFFSVDTSLVKQWIWKNGFNIRFGFWIFHITDFNSYSIGGALTLTFGKIFDSAKKRQSPR